MKRNSIFRLMGITAPLLAISAAASSSPSDEQWQCDAAPAGGWRCVSSTKPNGPFARTERPTPLPDRAKLRGEASANTLAETMDWVPRDQLDPAQAAAISPHCDGAYVEPPIEPLPKGGAVIGTIHASAAQSEIQQEPEVAQFSGDVSLRQDNRRLRADRATYFREEDRVEIEGNVQYREPGVLVRGDSAEFKTAENSGTVSGTRFVLHKEHTRGEAHIAKRNTDGSIDLEDGTYTQCEPGRDDWRLAADSIHLDRATGQGTARNARLEVMHVPVLYTPYLRFPIDDRRMTGFLWPSFTSSSENGVDLATPYYLNIAPNRDATFIPRHIENRGSLGGAEYRDLNALGLWTASGTYLPDDNLYDDDRWLSSLQQLGNWQSGLHTQIDYTKVSDVDYLKQLSVTGLEVKRSTMLPESASATYRVNDAWQISSRVLEYQMLDTRLVEPYKLLPQIELSHSYNGESFQPDFGLNSEYTVFEHQDPERLTGQRVFMEPMVSFPMSWDATFVKPVVGYRYIGYNLDQGQAKRNDDSPSVDAAYASLDSGYFLERETRLFGAPYLQTLEPRAYYLWSDYADHSDIPKFDSADLTFSFEQLFRPTRFSGHDRIADANQASVAVTSRLVQDDTGQEIVTASIGQIYYFEDRRVSVLKVPRAVDESSDSAIATEIQVQPTADWSVTGTTLWDTEQDQIDEGGVFMHWSPDNSGILNIGYRYNRRGLAYNPVLAKFNYGLIDQSDVSAVIPLGTRWKVFARYQYDLENNDSLEELGGLEYSSCCWSVQAVYQEGVNWDQKRDSGFYLQFVLRGLGGFGKSIEHLLADSIFGYGVDQENKEHSLGY